MNQYQQIISLRNKYPSTTASCQNLVMHLVDMNRLAAYSGAGAFHGQNAAMARFVRAFDETVRSAMLETGETNPERLRRFLEAFFRQFSRALPNWRCALDDLIDALFQRSDESQSTITRALQVWGRASLLPPELSQVPQFTKVFDDRTPRECQGGHLRAAS